MKRKPKILIVDDNEHNCLLFKDVFELKGFEATFLPHADGSFIEHVLEIQPDIISMDIMFGKDGNSCDRDGFQAIELLKADMRTQKIPVIVMTSFFEENKITRAKEVGAVDFISIHGHSIPQIPNYFLQYLRDSKHYKSSHPVFRRST